MEGGPPCFPPGSTCPAVLGVSLKSYLAFSYEAFTLCGMSFQTVSLNQIFCNSLISLHPYPRGPSTPYMQRVQAITHIWFGLFPVRSPLLGKSHLISFPPGTKMFQFPGSRFSCPIYSGRDNRGSPLLGSPIRISTDLCLLAAPRGVSPLAASFFASWYQGIHRTPFVS